MEQRQPRHSLADPHRPHPRGRGWGPSGHHSRSARMYRGRRDHRRRRRGGARRLRGMDDGRTGRQGRSAGSEDLERAIRPAHSKNLSSTSWRLRSARARLKASAWPDPASWSSSWRSRRAFSSSSAATAWSSLALICFSKAFRRPMIHSRAFATASGSRRWRASRSAGGCPPLAAGPRSRRGCGLAQPAVLLKEAMVVGALPPAVLRALAAQGVTPASAAVSIARRDLAHLTRRPQAPARAGARRGRHRPPPRGPRRPGGDALRAAPHARRARHPAGGVHARRRRGAPARQVGHRDRCPGRRAARPGAPAALPDQLGADRRIRAGAESARSALRPARGDGGGVRGGRRDGTLENPMQYVARLASHHLPGGRGRTSWCGLPGLPGGRRVVWRGPPARATLAPSWPDTSSRSKWTSSAPR